MNMPKLTLVSIIVLALYACAPDGGGDDSMMADGGPLAEVTGASGTIIDVAQGDQSFTTLTAAVTAADLTDTLSGEGPFTVFAPTNDAFAKIDEATLTELTTNDTETLIAILTNHVVEGAVDAGTLVAAIEEASDEGYTVTTVGGGSLTASLVEGAVVLTDAHGGTSTVIATDVEASNGLIHAIDTVLMP